MDRWQIIAKTWLKAYKLHVGFYLHLILHVSSLFTESKEGSRDPLQGAMIIEEVVGIV